MIQSLIFNRGGTIESYFVGGLPASCTLSLFGPDGTARVTAATCALDAYTSTLSSAAAVGDLSIAVASIAGIVAGRRYALDGEEIGVKSASGTTVFLWAPLTMDHASGAGLAGLRVTYVADATVANALWWDGYAVFTPLTGDEQTEVVDCVKRKIPETLIGESDIRQIVPKSTKALSDELDMFRAFRMARDEMLIDLGGKNRANTILGADHFRQACAMKFWLLRRTEFGDDWKATMDILERDYRTRINDIITQSPVDVEQDGRTDGQNDRGFTSIRVGRS